MNNHYAAALTFSALAMLACADVDVPEDHDASNEVREEAPPEAAPALRSLTLLQLSPTHTVEFLESDISTRVLEQFHADLDVGTAQKFLFELPREVRSLGDIYQQLAGERLDGHTLRQLQAVDGRMDQVRLQQAALDTELDEELDDEVVAISPAPELAALLDDDADGVLLGSTSQALCEEPAWNWPGDDQWFRDLFCPTGSQTCDTLDPRLTRGWVGGRNFEAFGFAQSHCSSATMTTGFRMKTRSCGFLGLSKCWRTFNGPTYAIPARKVFVHRDSAVHDSSDQYTATITTDGGNFVGLSARAW